MKHIPYVGSGPYCYANSFAMMLGADAPSTATIEFATSSPFGMQLLGGTLPFFDPYGWTPEAGFDVALDAMGWTSAVTKSNSKEDACWFPRGSEPVFPPRSEPHLSMVF
jgi:hypothetical protein